MGWASRIQPRTDQFVAEILWLTQGREAESVAVIQSEPDLAKPLFLLSRTPNSRLASGHANFVGHSTFRRVAPWKLFRDDEARHRTAGRRGGVLFHRQLSFDDLAFRRRGAPPQYPGCRAGFPCLRSRLEKVGLFPPIRRAGGDRAGLAAYHRDSHGIARTLHQ